MIQCGNAFDGSVVRFHESNADIALCLLMQVFCRVRPLDNDADAACVKVLSVSTVQLTQPEVCRFAC